MFTLSLTYDTIIYGVKYMCNVLLIILKCNNFYKMTIIQQDFFISILSAKKYSLYKWLNSDENLKTNGAFCFR